MPNRGWTTGLAAQAVSATLVSLAGEQFDPPPPLGEGSRYVKIRTLEDARAPAIRDWIAQAARHSGWS